MKRFGYLTMLLAVLLLFTSCTVGVSTGNLRGYVGIPRGVFFSSTTTLSKDDVVISAENLDLRDYYPLRDAKVSLSGLVGFQRTDKNGMFYFRDIPVGSRTVAVEHDEFSIKYELPILIERGDNPWAFVGGIGYHIYYIVIGIDNYGYVEPITGAVNDANWVYDLFSDETLLAGYVTKLTDREATRVNIKNAIADAASAARSTPNPSSNYLVVYFAGRMGQDFLLPWDGDYNDWGTSITDGHLENWLREFPGYVTVILDGNESATFADGDAFYPLALKKTKYTVLSSAGRGQNAYTHLGSGHGVFTHFLLAGLTTEKHKVDTQYPYQTITADEIFSYIKNGMATYYSYPDYRDYEHVPELHQGSSANSVIFRY